VKQTSVTFNILTEYIATIIRLEITQHGSRNLGVQYTNKANL